MSFRKNVWTLNIGNTYSPAITALTYPLIQKYVNKIDAEFKVITERKYMDYPITYEKLQIFDLGKDADWNIYIDSDALIHPDTMDLTEHISKDTVLHNGKDIASNRWKYDNYFRRDGRHIGCCNWFTVASNWCMDLWRPLDIPLEEALSNISLTRSEVASEMMDKGHLIDDYTLSRNIAKYGLKFKTFIQLKQELADGGEYLWHLYNIAETEKIKQMKETLLRWKINGMVDL